MGNLNDEIHVVIRSVGERTTDLCRHILLRDGLSNCNIDFTRGLSLKQSLQEALEIGVAKKKQWLLMIDADVLLFSGAIHTIRTITSNVSENTFVIKCHIFDKLLGIEREVGNVCFRTEMIPKALEKLSDISESTVKPTARVMAMTIEQEGYERYSPVVMTKRDKSMEPRDSRSKKLVVGVHDAEQYYKDIYRKCFVHGHKHIHHTSQILQFFKTRMQDDPDFKVGLKGFLDSLLEPQKQPVNMNEFDEQRIDLIIDEIGLQEKETIRDLEGTRSKHILKTLKQNPYYFDSNQRS